MRKRVRYLAALLSILILFSVFLAGCDDAAQTEPESSAAVSDAAVQPDEEEAAEASEGTRELTLSDSSVYEALRGKKIAVVTGMMCDVLAEELIPECSVEYYSSNADLALAVESGKADAYMADEPISRLLLQEYPTQSLFAVVWTNNYGYIFPKNSDSGDALRAQLDEFLLKIQSDGTLQTLDAVWFGTDEKLKTVDYSGLTGENGTLNFATTSSTGEPFCYLKNDQYVGYDIDIAVRFCLEYGYDIKIMDSDFSGMLAAVSSGKCDFGGSCITITEERKESMDFSEPNYMGGLVLVVKDAELAAAGDPSLASADTGDDENTENGFFDSLRESFRKTFLTENRWQLFADGVGATLLITIISTVCGTVAAFLIFLLYRKNYTVVKVIVAVLSDITEKTPAVVILMILYYIIFGKSALDGIWVASIGFSLICACTVIEQLKVAVGAVDKGQMEAALALGYTDTRAFLRVILPQSMEHFLPVYKGGLISLVKGTAIVGYIAVQDLTKVSDIVRSRTYEAFFPLIASAVIYFSLAWLLTLLIHQIRIRKNPKRRSKEKILKGVQTK